LDDVGHGIGPPHWVGDRRSSGRRIDQVRLLSMSGVAAHQVEKANVLDAHRAARPQSPRHEETVAIIERLVTQPLLVRQAAPTGLDEYGPDLTTLSS
jgi:hypothetical protein